MRDDAVDAIASIHDVEPRRLGRVLEIVDLVESAGQPPAMLLLVPGAHWSSDDLRRIHELVDRGWMVAGHGWRHRARTPRGPYHRIHAAVLSRDQAEHLSRSRRELLDLVGRCHAWFREVGLPSPELYVPPAWAMGTLDPRDLRLLPFECYETLGGIVSAATGKRVLLPLVGYEADTRGREIGLRGWNRLNTATARVLRLPVRVAIHPDDLHLRLAHRVRQDVRSGFRFVPPRPWLARRLTSSEARGSGSAGAGSPTVLQPRSQSSSASTASRTAPVPSPETQRT